VTAVAAVSCSVDAKNFQRLKTFGSIGIAATAMQGISIVCVYVCE